LNWKGLYTASLERTKGLLEKKLKDLTPAALNRQPRSGCNSIGWIAWHIARAQDRHISDIFGVEQLFLREAWYLKFGARSDPNDSGTGHGPDQAGSLKIPDAQTILDYHKP
jgi:hypothetical protein